MERGFYIPSFYDVTYAPDGSIKAFVSISGTGAPATVRKAALTAEARVVKAGSTLGYVECEVKDQAGNLVAKAASTCLKLREARPATT